MRALDPVNRVHALCLRRLRVGRVLRGSTGRRAWAGRV